MSLTAQDALRRQIEFLRGFIVWLGGASEGAAAWERPGVNAAIVPAAAERSILNSVIAGGDQPMAAAYDELADAYRRAGVSAWTVWVPEADKGLRLLLEERGHAFDGAPMAMVLELPDWEPEELGDLDWDAKASFEELGRLNDLAYGYEPETGMANALLAPAEELPIRLYRARAGGEVASVLGILDVDEDAGVLFVATPPEYRGHGYASRLLTAALIEARERGMKTSSLQASALGSPIYERLGFVTRFRFNIMEWRSEPRA